MHVSRRTWENSLDWVFDELGAIYRLEFMPEAWRPAFAFAVRSWSACMLALWIAFELELDQPYWAGLTVWMVTQPVPGMAISKGFYRIIGTIIGATMGVVLIALFSQAPELYILALAAWMGICTFLSNLLSNFRGYATVLAGYTAAIVSLGAYLAPDQVFDVAMARGSCTLIGIICSMVITLIFAPLRAKVTVVREIQDAIINTARRVALPLGTNLQDRLKVGRPLLNALIRLDTDIEFGSAESSRVRIHAGLARSLVAHLFAVMTAKRGVEEHLGRVGLMQDEGTIALYQEGIKLMQETPDEMAAGRGREVAAQFLEYHRRLWAHKPDGECRDKLQEISSRLVLDRLGDMALHFERAVTNWSDIQGGWKRDPVLQLNFHRDTLAASINGLRAFICVIIAGAFWIFSYWSSGSLMLIQFSVASALFSAAPHPEAQAMNFLKGSMIAVVTSYICVYHFLNAVTGFVPFIVIHALFLIPAAMLQLNPRYAVIGLAYCVFFFVIERPLNPMDFDPSLFFNNAVAALVGTFLGAISFRLFMPPNPYRARRYVIYRVRCGLKSMAEQEPIPPYWEWQTRMFDRINRLYDPANPSATTTDEWFEGGLSALHLGNEVLLLRHLIGDSVLPDAAETLARSVVRSFSNILKEPDSTRFTIQAVKATLQGTPAPQVEEHRRAWCRLQGIVDEMEAFFLEHPRFLTPG